MLKTLRIRNLAIIEELNVTFDAGLNVLTGETGAGKSILVDALGLVAGDRADSSLIRDGAERAIVEAVFELSEGGSAREVARERGLDLEDDTIVVRREVASAGPSRVFVNGSPSTVAVLKELGEHLVELHGQHEQHGLLAEARHAELLDEFGGHDAELREVGERHADVAAARKGLAAILERAQDRDARVEALRRLLAEIDAVTPRPGDLAALERDRAILRNASAMVQLLEEAVSLLYEGDSTAATLAAGAARRCAALAELDPSLDEIRLRVDAARVELEDAGGALRDYRDRTDFDPARLEAIEARRVAIERLVLRYGPDEQAVLDRRAEAARELDDVEHLDDRENRAREAVAAAETAYLSAARRLGRARSAAAGRMKPRVEAELAVLALSKARFEVEIKGARGEEVERDGERVALHPRGAESVEFLLSANPGEPPRPLAKVASGGELARVMLSLHVVLERAGAGRVVVFDEIDAGVSGAVADAVGARLAALADRRQVLCVTHLPQVAAHAERHYHVSKHVAGKRTSVGVASLSGEERVDELARMLGGRRVTAAATRNAAELIAAAEARRS
jgi:DNA repair protein RecN (Recombination protein N)